VRPRPFPFHCQSDSFLSVTRLELGDRYTGHRLSDRVMSMLEDLSLHYIVVGRGNDLDFLQIVAKHCGVHDRVHFLSDVVDTD